MNNKKCNILSSLIGSTLLRAFFLIVGAMMLTAGFNKLYFYVDFRLTGAKASGMIEHPATTTVLGGRPLIQYEDALGITHEFRSKAKTHWFSKPQKGEVLSVIYIQQDSQRAIVNNPLYYVILPLGFVVAGCFFSLQAVCQRNGARL
ncbi:MAG: hypothetical protein ACN4GW_02995 [Desulforhopalus sp.]